MKQPKPTTIDFETFGIEGRPKYPPIPVGVSIKKYGRKSRYYAFGHPTENNCCWSDAAKALREAYQCSDGILFQNAKFDVDVAEVWFGLPIPPWDKIHDTMFLLFLEDPHQRELGLKEASARLLDWPADEQDTIAEWLIEQQPIPGTKITRAKSGANYFGKYLCFAPGKMTGKYANGDVDRTEALFKLLWNSISNRNMLKAYDRERRLMPILLEMERQGLAVDLDKLNHDVLMYNDWRSKIDNWVIRKLKCSPTINLNSGQQLFNAMLNSGFVDETKAPLTPTGKYQTNKAALLTAVNNTQLLSVLRYRSQLNTCLNTFMIPWLNVAKQSNGLIFTHWNQVKEPKGGDNVGTRTGRLSSSPNFQNIPKEFESTFKHDESDLEKRKYLPRSPFKNLPALPKVRAYITPFKNEVLIDRDYSQQEPRILAHFDGGALLDKYLEDPWIDFHDYAKAELEKMGKFYSRKPVKNTNLGLIYGMGVSKLAEKNNMAVEESKKLKKAILELYPGLKEMQKEMKMRARNNLPVRTWGGREYFCEEAKIIGGYLRQLDYKLVNIIVQGSAADCTKEAIIRFDDKRKPTWRLILNVHDQLTASIPKRDVQKAMEVLRITVESVEFDVPMLSEGDTSTTNWDELKPYDRKGVLV